MAGARNNNHGFSLIEMTAALAISALLFGVAMPAMTSVLTAYRIEAARSNLAELKAGIRRYCEDTGILCASLANLAAANGVAAWTGPYVATTNDDAANNSAVPLDPWGHGFVWSTSGTRSGTLTCLGLDGVSNSGGGDDITTTVDVTDVLRAKSLVELEALNQAIKTYNKVNLPATPLPSTDINALIAQLLSRGYLFGSQAEWRSDAFGSNYVMGPNPVQQVTMAALP